MIVLLTCHSNNQPVSLTKQIADSGEGQVWETNINGYAIWQKFITTLYQRELLN